MFSGCLSVSGAALIVAAGCVQSTLAYNIAHNIPVGRNEPMHDEICGWKLLALGYALIAVDELVSFVCGLLVWGNVNAFVCGWADRQPFHLPREALFCATSVALFSSASDIAVLLQTVQDSHTEAPLLGYCRWLMHGLSPSNIENIDSALDTLFLACVVRVLVIGVQMVSGEGLNVFYLLPFPRNCGVSRELPPGGLLLQQHDDTSEPLTSRDYVYRLYTNVPIVGGCGTAHLVHNWLGALRMHVYTSSVLLLVSVWCRKEWFAEPGPSYSPLELSASMRNLTYTNHDSLFSSDRSRVHINLHSDASGHLLRLSSALLIVAGSLQLLGVIAKTWGVGRIESSLPSNHYHTSRCAQYMCP